MKKKGSIFFLCILCTMLTMSGCSQVIPLTDTEQAVIAEYIAHLMLKYDADYESTLAEEITVLENPSIVEEEFDVLGEEPAEENSSEKEDSAGVAGTGEAEDGIESEEPLADVELAEIFTDPEIQIAFVGCEEHESYPEDGDESFFSLVAPEGKKLAVMKFRVSNLSESDKTFNQLESEIKYRLDLDVETIIKPNMTLLVNDLQYMNVVLAPEEQVEAVVVFTVDDAAVLTGANLLVYTETKTSIEEIKE